MLKKNHCDEHEEQGLQFVFPIRWRRPHKKMCQRPAQPGSGRPATFSRRNKSTPSSPSSHRCFEVPVRCWAYLWLARQSPGPWYCSSEAEEKTQQRASSCGDGQNAFQAFDPAVRGILLLPTSLRGLARCAADHTFQKWTPITTARILPRLIDRSSMPRAGPSPRQRKIH